MTREEAITRLHNIMGFDYHYLPADDAEAMDMAIDALEYPEIIFCNECKYSFMGGGIMGCAYYTNYTKIVAPHCFCSWARRREE